MKKKLWRYITLRFSFFNWEDYREIQTFITIRQTAF